MDIKTLQTLVAIADHGSFAEASDAIGLSQSAVSLRIKSLEDRLGAALFDRACRPPMLNSEGHAFVEKAREVIDSWEGLISEFEQAPTITTLRLGAVPSSVFGVLPPGLMSLREAEPQLKIRLTTALSDRLEEMVLKRELDCAVVSETVTLPPGLRRYDFAREQLTVIAPAGMAGETDTELFAAAPYIRFKKHAWAGQLIEQEIKRRAIRLNVAMEVDTLDGISHLVASGVGISVVPERPAANPFPDSIRPVPFGDPPVHRVLGLIERVDNRRGAITSLLNLALSDMSGRICAGGSGRSDSKTRCVSSG